MSNPSLAPASGIVLAGQGTNRSLTITPGTNQFGTSLITVRVSEAAGQTASSSFLLTVNHVNHPPVLQPIPNQVLYQNAGTLTVPFDVYDPETLSYGLPFKVASSIPSLIPTNAIRVSSFQETALQITPVTNRVGFSIITLTASDGQAQTSAAFAVNVLPNPFTTTTNRLPSYQQGQAVWADFNNDSHLDLLIVGDPSISTPEIRYFRNNGSGGLVDSGLSISGQVVSIAAVGHFGFRRFITTSHSFPPRRIGPRPSPRSQI